MQTVKATGFQRAIPKVKLMHSKTLITMAIMKLKATVIMKLKN